MEQTLVTIQKPQEAKATPRKVLFLVPDIIGDKGAATAPMPGLAYVAGSVMAAGHEVKVWDMRVYHKLKTLFKVMREFGPEYVGLSFMTMEFQPVYDFVKMLKEEFPYIKLIMGGAGSSTLQDDVLTKAGVDFAITREGEDAMNELLAGKEFSQIAGLIWKNKDGKVIKNPPRAFSKSLDELPFPAYDLFPLSKYVDSKIPIVTSRGCPYQCTFCAMKASMGVAWRPRSPENIVKEIRHWHSKGFRQFHFVDDNFTLDMARAEKICDTIIASGMKIKWDLRNGIRADRVNPILLSKMKQAGCFYFAFGLESMDQAVLDKMKKGLKVEEAEKGVQMAIEAGIPFGGFFIIGLLEDTFERFTKTYNYAKKIPFSEVRFYNPIPFPGTELYQEAVERKLLRFTVDEYLNANSKTFGEEPIYETPEFTTAERKKALEMGKNLMMQKIIYKEFGHVLGTVAYGVWNIRPMRGIGKAVGFPIWRVIRKTKKHIMHLRTMLTEEFSKIAVPNSVSSAA